MWSSLGLALVVGLCLGVLADRLVLIEDSAFADAGPGRGLHWFLCADRGSLDIEKEPGYLYSEEFRSRLLHRLEADLELRPEQVSSLEGYLEERRHDAHEFWENSRHAYCDMRDAFRLEIREQLDETQRRQWDEWMKEADRREAEYARTLGARQGAGS